MQSPQPAPPAGPERGLPGRWLRRHLDRLDVALGVLCGVINVIGLFTMQVAQIGDHPPDVTGVLLALASGLPLAFRRKYPLSTTAMICGTYLAMGFLHYSSATGWLAVTVAVYTLGAYGPVRRGLALCTATAGVTLVYLLTNRGAFEAAGAQLSAINIAIMTLQFYVMWVAGRAIGARRIYLEELQHRADQLERTNAAEVRVALAEERTRVARELHDVVAHHVSVMTVQAAAAQRTLDRTPERAREAMSNVEETGRAALAEMRRIVGALRNHDAEGADGGSEYAPQAGVGELGDLLERSRDAGLEVGLTVIGTPRPLATGTDLAVYRVVQEALTNTLRHVGPTRSEVRLQYDEDAVVVTVIDDGNGGQRPDRPDRTDRTQARTSDQVGQAGPGHGLIGMRERVALNGGTVQVGQRLSGGYRVEARLPLGEAAP